MHHKYFRGNYGLYTRFWDIVAGTVHPDYERSVDELLEREFGNQT